LADVYPLEISFPEIISTETEIRAEMYLFDEVAVNFWWEIFCVFFLIADLNFLPMEINLQAFFFSLNFVEDTLVEICLSILDIAEFMDLFLVDRHTFSLEFTDLQKEKKNKEINRFVICNCINDFPG